MDKTKLLMLISLLFVKIAIAQTLYKGVVFDKNKTPLAGVSILSTTNNKLGVLTDIEGNFSIKLNTPKVRISYVGFKSKEVVLNLQTNSIFLEEEVQSLDEVVVMAYGSSKKKSVIGAASKVKKTILKRTASASFETALQGNVSGINVYTTGQPGGSSKVQIRGVGSISGLTQPLYVLDGVVINTDNTSRIGESSGLAINSHNPLSNLNTEDIESITVLKDAAAASLYGSRAANGVIVITTKQGINGETEFTFNSEFGTTFNLTKEETITGSQFRSLWEEGQLHQYIQNNEKGKFKEVYANSTLLTKYKVLAQKDYESIYGIKKINSDWLDEIYRTGDIQKYSLSARGGNAKTKFYVSGGYLFKGGTIIKSDYKRYSGRLNLENKAKDWLNLGANISVAKSERNSGQYDGGYAGGLNPLFMARVLPQVAPIYNANGYMGIADLPNKIEKNANPIGVIKVGKYLNKQFRIRANVFTELTLLKELKFKTTFGVDHQSNQELLYDNKEFGAGAGKWNGVLEVTESSVFQNNISNVLVYNKTFNEHSFNGLLGFESQVSKMKSIHNSGYDILDSELLSSSTIGTLWSWPGYSENYGLLSYLSQFKYNYAQKYYFGASFRRDGSSRLGENSRWGNFWSISGGWVLTAEDFINYQNINYLKLRASYGTNGNLPSQNYAAMAYLVKDRKGYGGQSGLSYQSLGNPDLSWELSKNFNIGLDGVVFNTFKISAEYFLKHTENLLLNVPISLTEGFSRKLKNYGEMKNYGFEVSLGYTPISTTNFSWNTNVNFTALNNKVIKLKSDIKSSYNSKYGQNPIITKQGESLNSFYLRDYAGVNKENGFAQYHVLENGKRTGKLTTDASQAGFGIFGKALQDFQGGFYNQFVYKNLSFDFLFTYGLGGKVYDRTAFMRDDDGYSPQFTNTKAQLNPWNPNNLDSNVPIRINGNTTHSNDVSTRHLYSADYLKLRNIKLSYKLPKMGIVNGGSVYAQADNLLLFTQLNDYDPEAISNGVNFFQTPTATSVVLGLQLKF